MSLFHAAAQPKVQLRKRAVHLHKFFKSRVWRDSQVIEAQDEMSDIVSMLAGNPDEVDLDYAEMFIVQYENDYPEALRWTPPMDDEAIALTVTAVWSVCLAFVGWLSWRYEPDPVVLAIPLVVIDNDELLAIRNAKAA